MELAVIVNDKVRKQIMVAAWSLYRADGRRPFGPALRAAWKRERKAQACARSIMEKAKANGGVLVFGDITRSPIRSALRGRADAARTAYRAAYTTAIFGR